VERNKKMERREKEDGKKDREGRGKGIKEKFSLLLK
jgi:hypothetical protein